MGKERNNSLYLFYGEETYLLENKVKKIKKEFGELLLGINYIMLNESNVKTLISEIETPVFGFEKKLIIVKNAQLFKKKTKSEKNVYSDEIAEYIEQNINQINDSVVLIFIDEEVLKNKLKDALEKYGEVQNFERLKPYQIVENLKKICLMYKVKIDDKTAEYLIETCGTDMQVLINEIRKLIEYVGENRSNI